MLCICFERDVQKDRQWTFFLKSNNRIDKALMPMVNIISDLTLQGRLTFMCGKHNENGFRSWMTW